MEIASPWGISRCLQWWSPGFGGGGGGMGLVTAHRVRSISRVMKMFWNEVVEGVRRGGCASQKQGRGHRVSELDGEQRCHDPCSLLATVAWAAHDLWLLEADPRRGGGGWRTPQGQPLGCECSPPAEWTAGPWTCQPLTPVSREESSEIQGILPDTFELDVQVGLLLAWMRCCRAGDREWMQAGRPMQCAVGRKDWVSLPLGGLGGEGQWPGDLEGQSSPWGWFCLGATPQPPRQSQVQLGTSPVVDGWTQAPGHSRLRSSSSLPRDTRLQDSVQILLPPAHFDLTILPTAPGPAQSWTPPGRPRVVEERTVLGQSWAWFPDRRASPCGPCSLPPGRWTPKIVSTEARAGHRAPRLSPGFSR